MIEALLFDFDGVIVDSWDSTIDYFSETLNYFNYPTPQRKDFISLLGLKSIDITRGLLPKDVDEQKLQEIHEYSKKMSLKYITHVKLIEKAITIIKQLKKSYKIGLVTSRGKATAKILLKKFKLYSYFDVIIDREDIQNHKPHPEGIHAAMKKLNVSKAVYIGDAKGDVEAARNAGIKSVLISTAKESFGADCKIPNISGLPKLIKKIDNES